MLDRLAVTSRGMILIVSTLASGPVLANPALLDLIEIMHRKGSLSDEEYRTLLDAAGAGSPETAAAEPVAPALAAQAAAGGGSWTDRVAVRGDVRLRYQAQDEDAGEFRDRGRFRYRLGVTARPVSSWEVGAGLASGGDDLRSTNQSFTGTFSSKPVRLDYAYARYAFNDRLKLIGGKFKFPDFLYTPADLLWDGDINPEGFSINYSHASPLGTTFANGGLWVLEENGSADDPHLVYGQLGQDFEAGDLFATAAASYYAFRDIEAPGEIAWEEVNTDYRFNGIYSLSGEIGLGNLFGGVTASLVADWVKNGDTVTGADQGYLAGLKASRGPWAFKYLYADLDTNAWPDILPDSDRYDGLTGVRGHELALEYELNDSVLLGLDYYAMERKSDGADQDLLQVDLNVRF